MDFDRVVRMGAALAAGLVGTLVLATQASAAPPGFAGGAGSLATALPQSLEQALSKGWGWGYLFVFLGGMVTCFTPCVYPLIAITVGIFAGVEERSRLKSLGLTGLYTLGLALTMSVLGLLAGLAGGQGLGTHLSNPYVILPLVVLFIALAASMFGAFELRLPSTLSDKLNRVGGAGPLGAFLMGLVGGLIALPCTGPVLAGILAFVGAKGNAFVGLSLLFVYAVGFGLMFWVVATFSSWLPKSGPWMEGVKSFFGVVLCVVALYFLEFLFPSLRKIGTAELWFLLISIAVAVTGAALGGIHLTFHSPKVSIRARKGVGLVLMIAGLMGALHYFITPPVTSCVHTKATTKAEVARVLTEAQKEDKPVIIDFWAIHCLPCVKMDKETFSNKKVSSVICDRFELVKVDCSKDTAEVRKLRKRYKAIQLPTVVILGSDGRVEKRLHGFVGPKELLETLEKVK
jgi:thiol:disulfide interchange protein DsbD